MTRSIRYYLFISFFISMAIASFIMTMGDYLLDRKTITAYFDDSHHQNIMHETLHADLIKKTTRNHIDILLLSYPIIGVIIWIILAFTFRSLTQATNELALRASTLLEPVDDSHFPIEMKPLVLELNRLFNRLQLALERNKRFAGDAAHELRTPLAALKTQTQVALKAGNAIDRQNALQKVIQCVDRSSHIVEQLLTLSRFSPEKKLNDIVPVNLHQLTTEMVAYLVPIAFEKNIEIELFPAPTEAMILGNEIALGILIRNIIDNAIRYTPQNADIQIQILSLENDIILRVIDSGPGIPIELHERIFERFFRILGTIAPGSGLGLAIVNQIAELHRAKIILNTPENKQGLQFDVVFSKYQAAIS